MRPDIMSHTDYHLDTALTLCRQWKMFELMMMKRKKGRWMDEWLDDNEDDGDEGGGRSATLLDDSHRLSSRSCTCALQTVETGELLTMRMMRMVKGRLTLLLERMGLAPQVDRPKVRVLICFSLSRLCSSLSCSLLPSLPSLFVFTGGG